MEFGIQDFKFVILKLQVDLVCFIMFSFGYKNEDGDDPSDQGDNK